MYRIEKIGENSFYLKTRGNFPPSVANEFVKDFKAEINKLNNYNVIIDLRDSHFLKMDSIQIILDLLKQDNEKLGKSAFVISDNLLLDVEFQYILDKAKSPKRKIVSNLEEAKKWTGIKSIIIQGD
ncbi:MAG: hypothetical protein ACTSQJ_05470 [Promethearchaeota archaeon]